MTPNPLIRGEALAYLESQLKLPPETIGGINVLSQLSIFHRGFIHNLYSIDYNRKKHMVDVKYDSANEDKPIPQKEIECSCNKDGETFKGFLLSIFPATKITTVEGKEQFCIPDAIIEEYNSDVLILESNGEIRPFTKLTEYQIDSDEKSRGN